MRMENTTFSNCFTEYGYLINTNHQYIGQNVTLKNITLSSKIFFLSYELYNFICIM